MAILKSSHTGWNGKKQGNMTQAMVKGEILQDVISISSDVDIVENDIVWLKNYPSSTVLYSMRMGRGNIIMDGGLEIKVKACLLGIDHTTKEPFAFTYPKAQAEDPTVDIIDNLSVEIDETAESSKKFYSAPYVMSPQTAEDISLVLIYCRGNQRIGEDDGADAANVNKLWKFGRDDETLAMIAEWTMRDLYTTAGASSGQAAANYDPSVKNGYEEFGIGLCFRSDLTKAQLEELQLKVTINYKDSMVSETSYGSNCIPVQVTY